MKTEEKDPGIPIVSPKKLANLADDPKKMAKAVRLVYVSDNQPGIRRVRKGKSIRYYLEDTEITDKDIKITGKDNEITDKDTLERIKRLVIPPAWEEVWICSLKDGHLQVTGLDTVGRKQYRYHSSWVALRDQTKYYRVARFARALPRIREQVEKDLARRGLPREKILAAMISLMERTHMRVGNSSYEKLYGSFGLSTLKDKHIDIKGGTLRFSFKGKKGVYQDISLKNPKLARIVQQCKEIPGKELFQYYDEEGKRQSVDSGMVNEYIREISGEDFTSKDFRTWGGTVNAFRALKEFGWNEAPSAQKKIVVEAIDKVAEFLGNTRAVCRKYYVHPLILSLYEKGVLQEYFDRLDQVEENDGKSGLTKEEQVVLDILESGGK